MKEKLIIDEKICLKHKMTLPEVLFALAVRSLDPVEGIPNMLKREILVEDKQNDWYKLTQRWNDEIEEILCDSSQSISETRLTELAVKIQEIFPSGFHQRNGRGPKYYFKSGRKDIAQALKRFIIYYGDHSDEDILKATKKYVADCRGDYSSIKCANYFVFKDERKDGGNITSKLNETLENMGEESEVVNNNEPDWQRYARN